ncbi:aspartyl aminopeptidase domain protein [Megasphaera sp. MJR8396C]|nr:aspartyl aminopeptidase domain protein [Megasphaera sp. MJR8396C]
MNRKTNQGIELNPQKDLLPVLGLDGKDVTKHFFLDFLSETCRCLPEAILSYELTVYPAESGCRLGWHDEFVSSPRLDNLTSVLASLLALVGADEADGLNVVALFDNEEVGSHTKQGADSAVLSRILGRIYHAFELTDDDLSADLAKGFMLSVDVAHAIHPNVPEKCDITNQPQMGRGVALKIASSQSYAGDAEAVAVLKGLCRKADIPYQIFMNRSDLPGGSTLGSLLSANLPIRTMDIGIPITAMHSCRELMGAADQDALTDLITAFFSHS